MVDKLVVTKKGIQVKSFTSEELVKREEMCLAHEEEEEINKLIPSDAEVASAEFELNVITLLTDLRILEVV